MGLCAALVLGTLPVSGAIAHSPEPPVTAEAQAALPTAGANPMLPADTTLTRIMVGSCLNERRPQPVWASIAAKRPDLFLMIGDNVYGDTGWTGDAALSSLGRSYAALSASPEFAGFRRQVPMMSVWDDHDFGLNDAGGTFAFRDRAETLFETFWGASDAVRSRPGVYDSRILGPKGRRVQLILLDTRYFRSDLEKLPYSDARRPLGDNAPTSAPVATMLGEDQWRWLEGELAKPAELRLIVSSVQVLTSAHQFESWANFPGERDRLYRLLGDRKAGNTILLSGDRHRAGLYQKQVEGLATPLREMTASSLNFSFGSGNRGVEEPDSDRTGGLWADPNFGGIDIDWKKKRLTLRLFRDDGAELESAEVPFPR